MKPSESGSSVADNPKCPVCSPLIAPMPGDRSTQKRRTCRRMMLWLVLAARGAVQVNAEREAGNFATCWLSAERTSLVVEAWVGSSAELCANWRRTGLPEGLTGVLAQGILLPKSILLGAASSAGCVPSDQTIWNCKEQNSKMKYLPREDQGCRPCVGRTVTPRRPLLSHCCWGHRREGIVPHRLSCCPEQARGDSRKNKSLPTTKAQDERMIGGRMPLILVLQEDAICQVARYETQSIPTGRRSGHVPGVTHFRSSKRERSSFHYFH